MANLAITGTDVEAGDGAIFDDVIAGMTITAGMAVYKKTDDGNEYHAADADTAAESLVEGIALHDSEDGQPLRIQTKGIIDIGALMTLGDFIVLSTTAGGLADTPDVDVASGDFPVFIGISVTVNNILLGIKIGTAARA